MRLDNDSLQSGSIVTPWVLNPRDDDLDLEIHGCGCGCEDGGCGSTDDCGCGCEDAGCGSGSDDDGDGGQGSNGQDDNAQDFDRSFYDQNAEQVRNASPAFRAQTEHNRDQIGAALNNAADDLRDSAQQNFDEAQENIENFIPLVLETTPGDIVGGVLQGAVEEGLNLPESVKGNLPLDDHLQNVNSTIDTAETESMKGVVKSAAAEALDMIGNSMRTDDENHLDVEDGEHGDALAEAAETADNPGENEGDNF